MLYRLGRRGPFWLAVCVLFPAVIGADYLGILHMQKLGPDVHWIRPILALWLAIAISARFYDIGWDGFFGFLLPLPLLVATAFFPAMRIDWLNAHQQTRTALEVMIPDTIAAYALLALLIIGVGLVRSNPARAIARCNRLVERYPTAGRFLDRAQAHFHFGNFDAAIADCEEALSRNAKSKAASRLASLAQSRKAAAVPGRDWGPLKRYPPPPPPSSQQATWQDFP